MKPWNLSQTNYATIKQNDYEVAVLPMGATEPHNLHLPYGTDLFEGTIVGEKICEAAWDQGAKVLLLPTIPYGTETNMREFPFAINLNPSTLHRVIEDVVDSLLTSGIRKVVILNSHGGNGFKPFLREMSGKTEAQLFLCDWFRAFEDVYFDIFSKGEDHAGEMETSFGLAYFPEYVAVNDDGTLPADAGSVRPMRFDALNKGWVSISRPWHLLTTNSGAADPHAASAAKGERMMEVLVERLGMFLVELSDSTIDDQFPF
ncbi:creatininase family protein [Mariniblastus fucicola]|uniref:Creatinine amidohydrolase n=1 Tax=Mariniblastus fucicola TaxID=980251 RepID=A0A5B9PIK0_9BACT|nr:creatininase family protein [Mariniblastus fucicola]QEG24516.1 Creatinine amidohydrolase [Mariniblastus fucicola]